MGNTTKKTTAYDETTKMQKELIALLLKKAGLKEKDVTEIALRRWALKNLDLLTAAEMAKYKRILAKDYPNYLDIDIVSAEECRSIDQ